MNFLTFALESGFNNTLFNIKNEKMKKTILLLGIVLIALFAYSKDHTIVVRGPGILTKGNTEVTTHENENSDSIIVTPGTDITSITVNIRNLDGTLQLHDVLSATGDYMYFTTPITEKWLHYNTQ